MMNPWCVRGRRVSRWVKKSGFGANNPETTTYQNCKQGLSLPVSCDLLSTRPGTKGDSVNTKDHSWSFLVTLLQTHVHATHLRAEVTGALRTAPRCSDSPRWEGDAGLQGLSSQLPLRSFVSHAL